MSSAAELAALLRAVAAGDRRSFVDLYRRTSAKLYGICLRLLRSEADAQDMLQDVYLTVWRKAGQFDEAKAGAVTWLGVLARNKAIDRLRRRSLATDDLADALDIEDDAPSATEIVEMRETAKRLSHCIEELEPRAQSMIRAAFLDGSTYSDLAEEEGVPLGTMKSWIRRALLRLRGCLDR